jgi:hypothetical protein
VDASESYPDQQELGVSPEHLVVVHLLVLENLHALLTERMNVKFYLSTVSYRDRSSILHIN